MVDGGVWMMASGVVGGLLAAVFGLVDYLAIPKATRAKRIGLLHAVSNVMAIVLFAASWGLRREDPGEPEAAAVMLSLMGLAVAGVGGWLGGELVERLGIGVHQGAGLNAPSSVGSSKLQGPRSGKAKR